MGFSAGQVGSVGVGMQAAGAAGSAVGAYYGAKAQRSLLDAQATIDDINAKVAEATARSALMAGSRQKNAQQLMAARVKGSQKAALAANGVDLGVGSAAEVQASTAALAETDANTIEANALRSAWGYRTQAMNAQNDAIMRRGAADGISPEMAGFTSLLGSSGTVASSWYKLKKDGS
jgi:hypothetical protein